MTTLLPVVDPGLGNSSYLVDLGDGRALAVDPSRDLRALRTAAVRHGLSIAFAADTHLHADFLTGALQLAADGATVIASAAGRREYPHRGLADGDDVDLGGLSLRALATPGHTDEHLAYLLLDGATPLGIFTGGSLIVGAAARTDLVDPARTEELARAQYRSVHRLVDVLPDDTAVYPTHGAGSFCAAPPSGDRTTTIGREKATNPLLGARDEDEFVARLLSGLGNYPAYFDRLAEINRRGPALLRGTPALTSLSVADVAAALAAGAQVVDVRRITEFARGHIPGALSIELRDAFASWLGWLADPDRPLVFVRDPEQEPEEIVWQAMKIGFESITGELSGGMTAWQAASRPVAVTPLVDIASLGGATVLDVRQDDEFASGHIPGARHVELGALRQRPAELLPGPVVVMCGHGQRATTGASLLEQLGRYDVAVLHDAGSPEWSKATGQPLELGGAPDGVAGLLARARSRLARLPADEAWHGLQDGRLLLVDIRTEHQRRRDGDLPGAWVVGRNVLEWRLDPACPTAATWASYDAAVVLLCDEGYSSSLAAATLHEIGVHRATDVIGGMQAWLGAGLPTAPFGTSPDFTAPGRRTTPA